MGERAVSHLCATVRRMWVMGEGGVRGRRSDLSRRGWTVVVGLGMVMAGCTPSSSTDVVEPREGTTPAAAVAEASPTAAPPVVSPTAESTPRPTPQPSTTPTATAAASASATAPVRLLAVADPKDGDSFVASDGVEYRVGMIHTPELSACGGPEAADRAMALLADGFTVEAYSADQYDRAVARIWLADGRDFGVVMASEGMADDRYLTEFRHEHPPYADELEQAFAAARATAAGLWSTCWAAEPSTPSTGSEPSGGASPGPEPAAAGTVAPQPLAGGTSHGGAVGRWACHPAYYECLPDGPDLDCGEVGHQVTLLGNADPYRLDGNNTHRTDGLGCETYPAWDPNTAYDYYA